MPARPPVWFLTLTVTTGLFGVVLLWGCGKSEEPPIVHDQPVDPVETFEARLEVQRPSEENRGPRWSPKGVKLSLEEDGSGWTTSLRLGPEGAPAIPLRLAKSESAEHIDRLRVDLEGDGFDDGDPTYSATPSERNDKIWSSFSGIEIPIPLDSSDGGEKLLELSAWYVEDPGEPEADQVLRYSFRSWMEGAATFEETEIHIVIIESEMDGVIDARDSWALALADDRSSLYELKSARPMSEHNWAGDSAFIIESMTPSGRSLILRPFEPSMTREAEEKQRDTLAPDRAAARSGGRVRFLKDFEKAMRLAKEQKKTLFIDFETTWCLPCKTMDQLVYTADSVVAASRGLVAVKVDGDERPDLVDRFGVGGYPTLVFVAPDGKVLETVGSYQSVVGVTALMQKLQ
ncbi:MAG: thioredoxin family protein [Planctomycetota bacterium]